MFHRHRGPPLLTGFGGLPEFERWKFLVNVDRAVAERVLGVECGEGPSHQREPDIERVWIASSRNGLLTSAQPLYTLPKDGGNVAGGQPVIADLNLDGRNDIAITSSAFDMVALMSKLDGSYRLISKPFPTAGSVIDSAIAVTDLNCDGCPDVLGNQGNLAVFPGVGCARLGY